MKLIRQIHGCKDVYFGLRWATRQDFPEKDHAYVLKTYDTFARYYLIVL